MLLLGAIWLQVRTQIGRSFEKGSAVRAGTAEYRALEDKRVFVATRI